MTDDERRRERKREQRRQKTKLYVGAVAMMVVLETVWAFAAGCFN